MVKEGTGNMVTLNLEGIRRIEHYFALIGSKLVNLFIIPTVIIIFCVVIDWKSALTMFLALPVIITFMILLGRVAKARATACYHYYRRLSNHFVDTLRGLETLKLLGLSKNYAHTVDRVSENYRNATMSTLRIAFVSGFSLDFFATLSIAAIALFLGIRLIDGTLSLAPALTVLILAPEYFAPIREYSGDYHATLDGKKALDEVERILNTIQPSGNTNSQKYATFNQNSTIMLNNISVASGQYQNNTDCHNLLDNISFSWCGFGKIAVIGDSGAGKSSLIELLGGFSEPYSGEIVIDGLKSHHLNEKSWQEQIIYIPQQPTIFQATLAENIRFYAPNATANAVRQASTKAGLDELLSELPRKLDQLVGEGGRALSGGEEQRVALARAFLNPHRNILLFDEPTAHVDIETEYQLKQNMLALMQNKLVFLATHRLHWLKEMDWVILLKEGKLNWQGYPQDLFKSSEFKSLSFSFYAENENS